MTNRLIKTEKDETTLIEKLMKIEAVFAGATTEGERISTECVFRAIPSTHSKAFRPPVTIYSVH